ncbi:MAG: YlxP-like protein [Candidatus Jettenia ecosi]|uniref:YlxP-like protein n=1 Tax=Candidatus Jettenia ecosi TaxID=2494326 RepID=A0A533QIM2_9BACT|nr:MAG: YlxP-like protein [Candidatus Jettenia ecosi]
MNLEFYKSNDTVIGVVNIRLVIRSANTLKDKRRIIKSLKDRIKNNFNVSIAETGSLDHCQYSQIGIAMVGNDNRYMNSVLSNLINLIRCANSVELVDYKLEFV